MAWDNRQHSFTPGEQANQGSFFKQAAWNYTPTSVKPWWMSESRWEREKAQYGVGQAQKKLASFTNAWGDKQSQYQSQLDAMKNQLYDAEGNFLGPSYTGVNWSDYQGRYDTMQNSLQSLLDRINQGTTTEDITTARAQAAQMLGMTPEQFASMESGYYNTTAEDITNRAQGVAFADDEYSKAFEAQLRTSQRAAEASMGKQLETIFADRGGLGGFAQAQEYTLQIQDQALQARTEFMVNRYNQALNEINAEMDRQYQMINNGQTSAADFLNQRWSQIQMAFEDTASMADQILKEFSTVSDQNRADYNTQVEAFLRPYESMKDILLTQMGVDSALMEQYKTMYELEIMPYLDAWAATV